MNKEDSNSNTRCGYVGIVGRPNVGKSTLLNYLLGQKIAITSRKPQTTRHNMLGIKTEENTQAIYVDTPGIHAGKQYALNRYLNREASRVFKETDLLVFLVDRLKWTEEDEIVLEKLKQFSRPVILGINKVDQIEDKTQLLPYLESISKKLDFAAIVPLSALKNQNLEALESEIMSRLPEQQFYFPEDQLTDRSERFMAAELVREKITRQLGDELPYRMTVDIEQFEERNNCLHINAVVYVERDSQKGILLGEDGSRIKLLGTEARKDMETLFDSKVMLSMWVKIKKGWSDDERAMRRLGYLD